MDPTKLWVTTNKLAMHTKRVDGILYHFPLFTIILTGRFTREPGGKINNTDIMGFFEYQQARCTGVRAYSTEARSQSDGHIWHFIIYSSFYSATANYYELE